MRVTRVGRYANTILAAIRGCRITALSALSAATTSFRARAEPRPSAVLHAGFCDAVYNAWYMTIALTCSPKQPISSNHVKINARQKTNSLAHDHKQAVLAQVCVLHRLKFSPTQSLPPFAGAGLLQFLLWLPPPQALEQAPNADQPPSTLLSSVKPSVTRHMRVA